MEIDILGLVAGMIKSLLHFYDTSFFFAAVKFFLFVYVSVLFIDLILLLTLKGISTDFKKVLFGAERPLVSRNKMIVRWEAILDRLKSSNPSQYKVAILEADALADELLSGIGYKGSTMAEKLEKVSGGQLETKEVLLRAHEIRNQIVHEAGFVLSHDEALQWLEEYKKFFDELELF